MPINARNASVTVGTSAVIVLPLTSPPRTRFAIKNTSTAAQVITLSFGQEKVPVAGEGVVLNVGETCADSNGDTYEVFKGAILGIASAAGGTVSVFEA